VSDEDRCDRAPAARLPRLVVTRPRPAMPTAPACCYRRPSTRESPTAKATSSAELGMRRWSDTGCRWPTLAVSPAYSKNAKVARTRLPNVGFRS